MGDNQVKHMCNFQTLSHNAHCNSLLLGIQSTVVLYDLVECQCFNAVTFML